MDDRSSFQPIHAAHAIEVVSAHMRMSSPIGAIAWGHALEAAAGIAEALGLAVVEPEIDADDDDDNIAAMLESAERTYDMRDEDGIVDVLRLTRREITFSTFRYTRWVRFSERAVPAIGGLARVYCAAAAPLGFRVSYTDRFVADDPECSVSDVLERSSPYLPPYLFEARGPWNTEGTFSVGVIDGHFRVCEHNLRYLDDGAGATSPSLSIQTVATDLRMERGEEHSRPPCDEQTVSSRLEGLHVDLKRYLSRIITSSMANRISLYPSA